MHNRSPRISPTLSDTALALVTINITAPLQPINTPPAFMPVNGSFNINADSIMAKIGIEVVTIEELTGEVMLNPIV